MKNNNLFPFSSYLLCSVVNENKLLKFVSQENLTKTNFHTNFYQISAY